MSNKYFSRFIHILSMVYPRFFTASDSLTIEVIPFNNVQLVIKVTWRASHGVRRIAHGVYSIFFYNYNYAGFSFGCGYLIFPPCEISQTFFRSVSFPDKLNG